MSFIGLPLLAPHTPLDAPQELQDKYQDINTDLAPSRAKQTDASRRTARLTLRKSARPMYAAVVDAMDQAIGQVLATLGREGIADNTIVLFFSDNGGAAYAFGGADNAPLRGGKGETFEGGIRVVSVMRWPRQLEPGQKMTQIMTAMDVFSTLVEAAGIEPRNTRKFDGRSMWPAIASGAAMPREELVYFGSEMSRYGSFSFTAFNEEWKLQARRPCFEDLRCPPVVHILRGHKRDTGVAMPGVIPVEKLPAESSGVLQGTEAPGKLGAVLECLELRFRERIVIAHMLRIINSVQEIERQETGRPPHWTCLRFFLKRWVSRMPSPYALSN